MRDIASQVVLSFLVLISCVGCRETISPVQPSPATRDQPSLPSNVDTGMVGFFRNLPGQFVVTIAADPACKLPDVARQRRYTASIWPDPWDPFLVGKFSDAKVQSSEDYDFWLDLPGLSSASLYIGDYLNGGFIMDDSGSGVLMMSGKADTVRVGEAVSGPVSGKFGYCDRPAVGGDTLEKACLVTPTYCSSESHRITLERRTDAGP